MSPIKKAYRDLVDTPFSIERLFVWTIGVMLIITTATMAVMAYQGKTIPPQLQSPIMIGLGAFVARIERGKK